MTAVAEREEIPKSLLAQDLFKKKQGLVLNLSHSYGAQCRPNSILNLPNQDESFGFIVRQIPICRKPSKITFTIIGVSTIDCENH